MTLILIQRRLKPIPSASSSRKVSWICGRNQTSGSLSYVGISRFRSTRLFLSLGWVQTRTWYGLASHCGLMTIINICILSMSCNIGIYFSCEKFSIVSNPNSTLAMFPYLKLWLTRKRHHSLHSRIEASLGKFWSMKRFCRLQFKINPTFGSSSAFKRLKIKANSTSPNSDWVAATSRTIISNGSTLTHHENP